MSSPELRVKNSDGGYYIPAHSVAETDGCDGLVLKLKRPTADSVANALVTDRLQIAIGDTDRLINVWPKWVNYDDGGDTPEVGGTVGTQANSFEVLTGNTGFAVLAVDTEEGRCLVRPGGGTTSPSTATDFFISSRGDATGCSISFDSNSNFQTGWLGRQSGETTSASATRRVSDLQADTTYECVMVLRTDNGGESALDNVDDYLDVTIGGTTYTVSDSVLNATNHEVGVAFTYTFEITTDENGEFTFDLYASDPGGDGGDTEHPFIKQLEGNIKE